MNYEEWARLVPEALTQDTLWKVEAYRLAVFLADIGWNDVTRLLSDRRTIGLSDQLYRSIGSISANVAEGYSRGTNRDRRASMSIVLDLLGRRETGITRDDLFSAMSSPTTASLF